MYPKRNYRIKLLNFFRNEISSLFALWHYALVDSPMEHLECCPNNGTMIGFVCEDEILPNQNKSVLQCSKEIYEMELAHLTEVQEYQKFLVGECNHTLVPYVSK